MIPAFLVNVDFTKNQLLNPTFQVLGTEPTSPALGQFFYNSTSNKFGYYNGTTWIYGDQLSFLGGNSNITFSRTGDTVTLNIANATQTVAGLISTTDKIKLDAATASNIANTLVLRDANGSTALNNLTATSGTVGTNATNATDIVNLQTLLNYLNTGTKYKEPVRVAVSTNVATLSGTGTFDGVALAADDRILLYGQTTASQNGLWQIKAGAWVRPTDFAAGYNASGVHVVVMEGTTNADNIFLCTTDASVAVVGTNNLAFNRLPNSIQVDNVTIELAAGVLRVKDLGISTAKLADASVTTVKILDANVTTAKIADANVTKAKLSTDTADQVTIKGGAGTSFYVTDYTPIAGKGITKTSIVTGVTIGSGVAVNITHNLNTTNIASCLIKDSSTNQVYETDWAPNAANTVAVTANGANKTITAIITA